MINDDKVTDVDTSQKYEEEWAQIYHIKIIDGILQSKPFDEFEWACLLQHAKYYKIPSKHNNYDIADEMEMRASKIYRDIYAEADRQEKKLLSQSSFVATDYILNYRLRNT